MFCPLLGCSFKWILLTDPDNSKLRNKFNWSQVDRESVHPKEANVITLKEHILKPGLPA